MADLARRFKTPAGGDDGRFVAATALLGELKMDVRGIGQAIENMLKAALVVGFILLVVACAGGIAVGKFFF